MAFVHMMGSVEPLLMRGETTVMICFVCVYVCGPDRLEMSWILHSKFMGLGWTEWGIWIIFVDLSWICLMRDRGSCPRYFWILSCSRVQDVSQLDSRMSREFRIYAPSKD